MTMSVKPDPSAHGVITLEKGISKESREQLSNVWAIHLKAAQRGVTSALSSGPLLSFPVISNDNDRTSKRICASVCEIIYIFFRSLVFNCVFIRLKWDLELRS